MKPNERSLAAVVGLTSVLLLQGCAIASRSDKFGADLEIGVGGLLGYVADLRFKGSVGFSKTCNHGKESHDELEAGADPDPLRDFL